MRLSGLFALLLGVSAWEVSYRDHQVARCQLENQEQALWMLQLQADTDVDIWAFRADHVDVRLAPQDKTAELIKSKLNCTVFIDDVEKEIEASMAPNPNLLGDFYDAYADYATMQTYARQLQTTYPNLARYFDSNTSTSIEGRVMFGLRVSSNLNDNNRPTVYIQAGLHAREWAGPPTAMFIAEALLFNYTRVQNITDLMNRLTFQFVFMANPDGYVYSWTNDRMWRKNRRNNGNNYGVDLNRNWNCHWGGPGSSNQTSSDTYRGTAAFSEPETRWLSTFSNGFSRKLGAVDYHAYGPLVLRSYGWTSTPSPQESWLKPIGDAWSDAIFSMFRVRYTSEKAAELYVASGCADDWFTNDTVGARYPGHGWTIELRGNSFLLPAAQIRPCGIENMIGFLDWVTRLVARFPPTTDRHDHDDHITPPQTDEGRHGGRDHENKHREAREERDHHDDEEREDHPHRRQHQDREVSEENEHEEREDQDENEEPNEDEEERHGQRPRHHD